VSRPSSLNQRSKVRVLDGPPSSTGTSVTAGVPVLIFATALVVEPVHGRLVAHRQPLAVGVGLIRPLPVVTDPDAKELLHERG